MALTGDFARLAAFRQQLAQIARAGALRTRLFPALATEVHKQVIAGFAQQRDPYGRTWAPRKRPADWAIRAFGLMQDNHPILDTRRTDGAVNRLRARPTARGVVITTSGYMQFHLTGTKYMKKRMWVPDMNIGLGPIWGNGVNRVTSDVLRALMGGG